MDTITPEPMARKAFTDPVAAWAYISEIYQRNTEPMNNRRMELLGEARRIQDPDERLMAILRAYVLPAFSSSSDRRC